MSTTANSKQASKLQTTHRKSRLHKVDKGTCKNQKEGVETFSKAVRRLGVFVRQTFQQACNIISDIKFSGALFKDG